MKIAFKIIKTGSGNDVYFQNLAKGLRQQGINVDFVYYSKIFQFFPFLMKLFNKKTDADIIHTNIEYAWAVKESGKPLIATVHHLVFDREFQRFTSLPQKLFHYLILWPNTYLSIKAADKIIAVSQYTRNCINHCYGVQKKVVVIYNGIDLNIFKSIKVKPYHDGKFHLLFVGNLIKRKGADLLPKIMEKLGKDYVLHYTRGLRKEIPNGFGLNNMFSLGDLSQQELVKEYNKCDTLLFPTRLEGFGYVVTEAMSCEKPVISSNNSSLSEILINGRNGVLCQTDKISEFVSIIKEISMSKKLYFQLSKNNRSDIQKKFSTQKMLNNYKRLYKNI